ncbi:hypothetical protein [Halosolutus halophilus]
MAVADGAVFAVTSDPEGPSNVYALDPA